MIEFDLILNTIKALRHKETGCPWDREQTLKTLVKPLQEETEEFIEALHSGNNNHTAEELGDVIWNAMMLLEVAEEEGIASKEDVLNGINDKMLVRHPHVFGNIEANSKEEAIEAYQKAKANTTK